MIIQLQRALAAAINEILRHNRDGDHVTDKDTLDAWQKLCEPLAIGRVSVTTLHVGDRVRVTGDRSHPHLVGAEGVIQSMIGHQYRVCIDSQLPATYTHLGPFPIVHFVPEDLFIVESAKRPSIGVASNEGEARSETSPVPMRLVCEACGELHIDEGEFVTRPHHTHSCQHCGLTWRPAIIPTVGVRFLP